LARITLARALLMAVALAALAFSACAKSNNSALPPGATPTPTATPTIGPSSTPPPAAAGIAFVPDAENGGPSGVTVAHFEEFTGAAFPYAPQFVGFQAPVRYMAIDSADTTALAVMRRGSGSFTLLQGILGLSGGNIFPGGTPYDTSIVPPSPAPPNAFVPDVTDEEMLSTAANAVGLSMGPAATGILGVNQVGGQTPTYNGFVDWTCKGRTPTVTSGFTSIGISPITDSQSGDYSLLVRGPTDLLTFNVVPVLGVVPPKFSICFQVEAKGFGAATLGIPGAVGRGLFAFSPTDPTRAFLGQVGTATNAVQLVTGLPFAITPSAKLVLSGGRINSVAVAPDGDFAAVATNEGLFIVGDVEGSSLTIVGQGRDNSKKAYTPFYKGPDGKYHPVMNVTSIGFSLDGAYLAALVSLVPDSQGGGTDGTLVVLPFSETTGKLAAPAVVDNHLPRNAYYQDILTVR
jgi:hypothetical protein